jgi:hypothetical protein
MTGYPTRVFSTLYHLCGPAELRGPNSRMPACCMPVSESAPQSVPPPGRVWRLSRAAGRFLDIDRLTKRQSREIMDWGVERGLARHVEAWEVRAYDREQGAWRTVRCTDSRKAAIVLTEPFMSRRNVAPLKWFVATEALETWYRDRVLPDAAPGVLSLKYALDELDCDGAFSRWTDGTRTVAVFAERLARWAVAEIHLQREPVYSPRQRTSPGAHLDAYC